jgi:methyl-accepting chemotaxis protein
MSFNSMKVATRLTLGFGLAAVLTALVGLSAYIGLSRLAASIDDVYSDGVLASQQLAKAQDALWSLRFGVSQYLAVPKPESRSKIIADSPKFFEVMDKNLELFGKGILSSEEKEALAKLNDIYGQYKAKRPGWFELMEAGKIEEAAEYRSKTILQSGAGTVKALSDLIEIQAKDSNKVREEASALATTMVRTIVGMVLFAIVASVAIAALIVRSVLGQLGGEPRYAAEVVGDIAKGDLTIDVKVSRGDTVSLLHSMKVMQDRLRNMIGEVRTEAIQVGDMARSLASSAGHIAQNVTRESDAVSGMATAIEELSASTTHISDQGTNAKSIANNSRSSAEEGAQVVNKTVAGLLATAQEIDSASSEVSKLGEDASRISDVVKVIKEIADQTNLLALNAAIEAARAGEQGRGFAVVADEVRKLAERTAGATNEINQMSGKIGDVANQALSNMDKVVKSTRQEVGDAEVAQASIAQIQRSFGDVAGVIDDIATALAEQNAAASSLAKNTEFVSQLSEENANAANDLLRLANALEGKAGEVRQAVEVFRV